MEAPAPPPPTKATWRWQALALLIVIAATSAPTLLVNRHVSSYFQVGPTLFSLADMPLGPTQQFGPFPVREQHFYQIEMEAHGTATFQLCFDDQVHRRRRRFVARTMFDESERALYPVAKAGGDDPAAVVTIEVASDEVPRPLRLRRLAVFEISKSYFVWHKVVRAGSFVALLAGMTLLGWQYYRRWSAAALPREGDGPAGTGPQRTHRLAVLAVVLLALAGSSGAYILQERHAWLFRQPPVTSIYGWDDSFYYFWLRSAMTGGGFDFTKDLRYCNSMDLSMREDVLRNTPRTKTGLFPNKYPIGWALLEVPWYVAADLTAAGVNLCGGEIRRDGWQPIYQTFLIVGQVVYTLAGLWFSYRILQGVLPPAAAMCGLLLGWLCSPLGYYQTLEPTMSHNVLFCTLTGAYYSAGRLREDPGRLRHWVAVGLCCALVILSRYQGAVMLLFPGVVCLQEVWRDRRRWKGLACGIVASLVPLAMQALAWKVVYGSWLLYTYGDEGFDWLEPHLYEVLFSPNHGLFNWHPGLLVGFLGFAAWAVSTTRRTEAACFGASLVLMIYVNASWSCWWFGDSFGSRAFDGCTLYAMLGSGYLLHAFSQRRVGFALCTAVLLSAGLWNLNMLFMATNGPLTLSRPIPWGEKIEMTRRYWLPGL